MEMFTSSFQSKALLPELPSSKINTSSSGEKTMQNPSPFSSFKLSRENNSGDSTQSFTFNPAVKLPAIPPNQSLDTLGFAPPKLTFNHSACNGPSTSTQQTKKEEKPQDPTELAISELIDSAGGVSKVDKVIDYIELMKMGDHSLEKKSVLLTMMVESRPLIQEAFISNGGLFVLDEWLEEEDLKLTTLVLKLLVKLPVDMQALKDNGSIGKTVGKLTTHEDTKIKKQAKAVLKAWKRLVDRAVQKQTKKRKQLSAKEEPASKIPRISSSSAFRTQNASSAPSSELNVVKVKRTKQETKDNQSNKVNSKPKPDYKPLRRLIDKNDAPFTPKKTPTLPQRIDLLRRAGALTKEEPFVMPDLSRQPTTSCLPDPSKKKSRGGISWAPEESLVKVKLFRRDKSLALNNPGMQMIKARIAQAQVQAQAQAQAQAKKPEVPSMRPSVQWRKPTPINLPSSVKVAMGENSNEVSVQRNRERTVLKARYPDARQIPQTPGNDNSRETPIRDEDIPAIPLNDLMKQPTVAEPAHSFPSPPPYDNYNAPQASHSQTPYYPPAAPAPVSNQNDILRALQSGAIAPDLVQSLLANPNEQNAQQLRNLLAAATANTSNYPQQQRPPVHHQPNAYPNYPPAHNYSHNANSHNYNQYPPSNRPYYPPNGRY